MARPRAACTTRSRRALRPLHRTSNCELPADWLASYPDVFIHTHLAEKRDEVRWVRQLFPDARSYLDVYDRAGLLRDRATYAHCIHLDAPIASAWRRRAHRAAFCPTSNLYLGSGLFDIAAADAAGLKFALATDVGGGTSFSMLEPWARHIKSRSCWASGCRRCACSISRRSAVRALLG